MSLALLVTAGLVFARLAAALSVLPALGASGIPATVRLPIAVALTLVVTPTAPAFPGVPTLGVLLVGLVGEILLGILMGGAVAMVFGGLAFGSEIISTQTGRAIALQFNPLLDVSQGPVAALAGMMATLVFLGADLHLIVLITLADSFHRVQPGQVADIFQVAHIFTELAAPTLHAGLKLAGPALALVFLVNVFIAVLARLAPSMNVFFSIGFLLTMMAGTFLVYLSFPQLLEAHTHHLIEVIGLLPHMADAARGQGG